MTHYTDGRHWNKKTKAWELDKEDVSAVALSAGLASIEFTRAQEKQLKYLTGEGGKYSAGTIFVQMPNGKTMSVDPLGRVETIAG